MTTQRDITEKLAFTVRSEDIRHDFEKESYTVKVNFIDRSTKNLIKSYETVLSHEYISDLRRLDSEYLKKHNGPTTEDVALAAMEAAFQRFQALDDKIPEESSHIFKSYS